MSILSMISTQDKTELVTRLHEEARECKLCPIHKTGMGKCALYRGNPDASIMIVSEKSGPSEADKGYPFAGASEREVESLLKELKLSWENVIATNRVICNVEQPKNEHIKNCTWWKQMLSIVAPKIVIAMGRLAIEGITGQKITSVSEMIGQDITVKNVNIVPAFNPAYLLRLREVSIEQYREERKRIIASIQKVLRKK